MVSAFLWLAGKVWTEWVNYTLVKKRADQQTQRVVVDSSISI